MNKEEVMERLVESRVKAQEEYDKALEEFTAYIGIWEALDAIRANAMKLQIIQAIQDLELGRSADTIMATVDFDIKESENTMTRHKEMNFPSIDILEDEYILGGIKRAKRRIMRAINPDIQLVPVIKRIGYSSPYEIPPNEKRVIMGIEFTHEYDKDGDPKSNIYVEKGSFSASLTCAADTGEWVGRDDPVQIPASDMAVINRVYKWWVDSEY